MRRLLFVATGVFFIVATLLPTQRTFVVSAVTDGERLAMYSKPAVVRIVDGAGRSDSASTTRRPGPHIQRIRYRSRLRLLY